MGWLGVYARWENKIGQKKKHSQLSAIDNSGRLNVLAQ